MSDQTRNHVEQYYTVMDVAKLLRRSRWTIGRWIDDGTLPATDFNPRAEGRAEFRVKASDLQTLIERLEINTKKRSRRAATKKIKGDGSGGEVKRPRGKRIVIPRKPKEYVR